MGLNKELQAFLDSARETDEFWSEELKLDFAIALERQRRLANISYAEFARRVGCSAPYITKVFRGGANLTIDSMVKLSRAVGANISFSLHRENRGFAQWGSARLGVFKRHAVETENGTTKAAFGTDNGAVVQFRKVA